MTGLRQHTHWSGMHQASNCVTCPTTSLRLIVLSIHNRSTVARIPRQLAAFRSNFHFQGPVCHIGVTPDAEVRSAY